MKGTNVLVRLHKAEQNEKYEREKRKEAERENRFLKKKLKFLRGLYASMKTKTLLLL